MDIDKHGNQETKIGKLFKFTGPGGWRQFQDGNRYVFHGPQREELIVSGALVKGTGSATELAAIQRRVFQHAEESMMRAAADPTLKVTQTFQKDVDVKSVECWTLQAQTHDGEILFYQAMFSAPHGSLLATFEAPNTTHSVILFRDFINSVEEVTETQN